MACCVFIAFVVSRAIRGIAWLVRPLVNRLRPAPATLTPAIVTVSGSRFVRTP